MTGFTSPEFFYKMQFTRTESQNVETEKRGHFRIHRRIIRDAPHVAKALLRGIIVVRAEMMYIDDAIEYWGYADFFPETDIKSLAPFMTADFEVIGKGPTQAFKIDWKVSPVDWPQTIKGDDKFWQQIKAEKNGK